jgi:hypothetical protein
MRAYVLLGRHPSLLGRYAFSDSAAAHADP